MNKNYIPLSEVEIVLYNIVRKELACLDNQIDFFVNINKQDNKKLLGFTIASCRIEIFLDNFLPLENFISKILYKACQLVSVDMFVNLVETTFHECFHNLAFFKPNILDDLDNFIVASSIGLRSLDSEYYKENHDLFYDEILADLFGNIKAQEFLKENYPDIYLKNKINLDKELEKIKKRFVFFDFNHNYQKHYSDHLHEPNSDKFISVKAIYDMYKEFDERIPFTILTLNLFLEQLDINSLSVEEIEIMELAIEYAYNKELLKKNYIDNNFKLDDLNDKDMIYYKENINRLKYFEEIDKSLKSTRKRNILKKTKN